MIDETEVIEKLNITTYSNYNKPSTLQYFYHKSNNKTLNLNPSYQRGEVWPDDRKIDLINSILSGITLPPIILNQKQSDKFDVMDGKQRLTSIIGFMNNIFPIVLDDNVNLYFSKIPDDKNNSIIFSEECQESFKNKEIQVTIYNNLSEQNQRDIFQRINYGSPLRTGELLKALNSKGLILIEELISKHNNKFVEIGIKNDRCSNYLKIAAIIALVKENYEYSSAGKPAMKYFEKWNYSDSEESEIMDKMTYIINEIYNLHKKIKDYHSKRSSNMYNKKWNYGDILFNIHYINKHSNKFKDLVQFNKFLYHWKYNTNNIKEYINDENMKIWEIQGRKNTNNKDVYIKRVDVANNILSNINRNIPKSVKDKIVHFYFKDDKDIFCLNCKKNKINRSNFQCGHIISKYNGGILEFSNLKPICGGCNSSMGVTDMDIFNPNLVIL